MLAQLVERPVRAEVGAGPGHRDRHQRDAAIRARLNRGHPGEERWLPLGVAPQFSDLGAYGGRGGIAAPPPARGAALPPRESHPPPGLGPARFLRLGLPPPPP